MHLSRSHLWRIAHGRNTGRQGPGYLQLAMIAMWHVFVFLIVAPLADCIHYSMMAPVSRFWYELGVSQYYIPEMPPYAWPELSQVPFALLLRFVVICVAGEGLLGWLGYRWINRRPRPRWYRFARYWWRACPYGTALLLVLSVIEAAAPQSFMIDLSDVWLIPVFCAYFGLTPALLARREIVPRARRLAQLCPVCRYSLRGLVSKACPECGTPVVKSPSGGYRVRREPT